MVENKKAVASDGNSVKEETVRFAEVCLQNILHSREIRLITVKANALVRPFSTPACSVTAINTSDGTYKPLWKCSLREPLLFSRCLEQVTVKDRQRSISPLLAAGARSIVPLSISPIVSVLVCSDDLSVPIWIWHLWDIVRFRRPCWTLKFAHFGRSVTDHLFKLPS